jgi:hypothetical protein
MSRIIRVSRDQVSAARALIVLHGGADKVDPLIRKIAEAKPANGTQAVHSPA